MLFGQKIWILTFSNWILHRFRWIFIVELKLHINLNFIMFAHIFFVCTTLKDEKHFCSQIYIFVSLAVSWTNYKIEWLKVAIFLSIRWLVNVKLYWLRKRKILVSFLGSLFRLFLITFECLEFIVDAGLTFNVSFVIWTYSMEFIRIKSMK